MKKKLLAGTVLSICLLSSGLSACSSEDKTEKPSSENQLQSDYMEVDGILTKTEKGSFSVHDGLMYFTDYETQTSIPVCGKPNCCIFRKNRALAPHERSAVPLGTDHCPVC